MCRYLYPSTVLMFACLWAIMALFAFWVQVSHAWTFFTDEPEAPPLIVWGVVIGFLFLPTKSEWSCWSTRRRFLRTLGRVLLAGFVPVMWRDVLLANILSSLVKPLVDINHFACYSWTESFFEEGNAALAMKLGLPIDDCGCVPGYGFSSHADTCVSGGHTNSTEAGVCTQQDSTDELEFCNQYSSFDALVTFLPYWFRFAQQCRRWIDSSFKSKRDLINAGKYFTSLCVVSLSWADHMLSSNYAGRSLSKWEISASPWKAAWAGAALLIYACCFICSEDGTTY